MRCSVVVVALLTLNSCHLASLASPPPPKAPLTVLPHREFPDAAALLDGFDARSDGATWIAHDQVLFGLRLQKGEQVLRWLLHLEAPRGQRIRVRSEDGSQHEIDVGAQREWSYSLKQDDGSRDEFTIKSRLARVVARVLDEQGTELSKSSVALPVDLLGKGLLPAIDHARRNGTEEGTKTPDRSRIEAFLAMRALLDVVRHDKVLAGHFWQVVDKPSLWSVLGNAGISTSLSMPFEDAVPLDDLPSPHDAARVFSVPLRIEVNGAPALLLDVVATDARRPFAICGGMLAAVARHPAKADVSFEIQLLAARLGSDAEATIAMEPPVARKVTKRRSSANAETTTTR